METRTVSLDSLLKDGLLNIPSYQRSYSWEESQLRDLLDDLVYLPEDSSHFFGNIILDQHASQYSTDKGRRFNVYDIVDGQQRLTSALIFLDVAADHDDLIKETLAADNLIFPIRERPRLLPQDQDEEFFRDCLFGNANTSPETPSQVRLEQAQNFFDDAFANLPEGVSIQELAENLRYDLQINVVEIDAESEAASIFESLNDRGRPLSTLDKTKSFLMYMDERSSTSGSLESVIKQRFGSIYKELFVFSTGHDRINDFEEDSLQRFHWGMYDGYDSDEYFRGFEALKSRLRKWYRAGDYEAVQQEIDKYVQDLRNAASAFTAVFSPNEHPEVVEQPLRRLLELGRLANVSPILMASYLQFKDDSKKFAAIVRSCETLVFRMYAIDSRRSNTGRGKMVNLAHKIHSDESLDYEQICEKIDSITATYTADDRFARQLRAPDFYGSHSSRDIRYLFYWYNRQLDADANEETDASLSQILSTEYQVEHILAQKVDTEQIPEDLREEFDECVHRLGNLTLASRYWNNSYGNLPFNEKKHAGKGREKDYASSVLRVQRELVNYDTFGREAIENRTDQLIEFTLAEWSITPPTTETSTSNVEGDFDGYVPAGFFDQLTRKQEAFVRILWDADEPVGTSEILRQMEEDYNLETKGSSTSSGLLAGMTRKFPSGYRRSIMTADWAGTEYEFSLVLDTEQQKQFTKALGDPEE